MNSQLAKEFIPCEITMKSYVHMKRFENSLHMKSDASYEIMPELICYYGSPVLMTVDALRYWLLRIAPPRDAHALPASRMTSF